MDTIDSTVDAAAYFNALKSEPIQQQFTRQSMPMPLLAACIESGIVDVKDEALLFEIEKSVGRRLKPKNPPTADLSSQGSRGQASQGGPVLGSAKPPCLRGLPTSEMYRQTVAEMEEKQAKDKVLDLKHFPKSIVHNARKTWCTPALMRALVMDPEYVDKLRAAMYPATMSVCIRNFESGGRTYVVPYITVMEYFGRDGTYSLRKGEDEKDYEHADGFGGRFAISTTFYLDKNGGIGAMTGSRIHLYDPKDFSSPAAVKSFMKELEESYRRDTKNYASDTKKEEKANLKKLTAFLSPYASGVKPIESPEALMRKFRKLQKTVLGTDTENDFLNIKTGEWSYGAIRHNIKEVRKYGNDWYKVLDVTGAVREDGSIAGVKIPSVFEKQRPGSVAADKSAADLSLQRLYERMYKTVGLEERMVGYVDPDGEKEYLENDFSI